VFVQDPDGVRGGNCDAIIHSSPKGAIMNEIERLRAAMSEIAKLAARASGANSDGDDRKQNDGPGDHMPGDHMPGIDMPGCSIKSLPKRLLMRGMTNAVGINPVNAVGRPVGAAAGLGISDPLKIAVLTAKYWGPSPRVLTVSFLESQPPELRRKILRHMNAWAKSGCISFAETGGTGNVRIAFGNSGYWSYLGTDILLIPSDKPTMNLQAFSEETPDSEFHRVVRHETGHTLGFPHEHMRKGLIDRLDRTKTYAYFLSTQGWDKAAVNAQVLTPLAAGSFTGTPEDETSIMCYQLPASITKDGQPIAGGLDINATDYAFNAQIYPKGAAAGPRVAGSAADDWPEEDDVD
jgi:astacin (peptidase family M12A)